LFHILSFPALRADALKEPDYFLIAVLTEKTTTFLPIFLRQPEFPSHILIIALLLDKSKY